MHIYACTHAFVYTYMCVSCMYVYVHVCVCVCVCVYTTDWFQIGKGAYQGCVLIPCLFNLDAEYIMRNVGLDKS